MDQRIVTAFLNSARLSRAELGVDSTKLRPITAREHADTAVPGFVGPDYRPGGFCLVSVNPAGGKDDYRATAGDHLIYGAAAAFASCEPDGAAEALQRLGNAFISAMPGWGAQWRHVSAILTALELPLGSIAYPYLVPFRTRGDSGSKLPEALTQAAARRALDDILETLSPGYIIAMDGPSMRAAERWSAHRNEATRIFYYTRKRDAHREREMLLRQFAALRAR